MTQPKIHGETRHAGEHILAEAEGQRSIEEITIASGAGRLAAGTVLGQVTATEEWVAYDDDGADDGRRSAAGILFRAVDATDEEAKGVAHVRSCEVHGDCLTGLDDNGIDDLLALGIVVRA